MYTRLKLVLLQGEVESLHGEIAQLTSGRAADKQHSSSLVAGLRQELQASQEAEQAREEELNDLANAREAVQSELAGKALCLRMCLVRSGHTSLAGLQLIPRQLVWLPLHIHGWGLGSGKTRRPYLCV